MSKLMESVSKLRHAPWVATHPQYIPHLVRTFRTRDLTPLDLGVPWIAGEAIDFLGAV